MNKEKIVLIGAGQHARVVKYNIECQDKYEIVGILDEDISRIGEKFDGIEIVGSYLENLDNIASILKTKQFIISFGNMNYRKKVYDLLIENDWKPVNVIHPNAVISTQTKLGKGILIECGCLITPNPIIGNNVVVNTGSQVNHDNIICNNVYIASGVILSGGVIIGDNTLIDDGVIVALGKKVGINSIVGAGSVVTRDLGDSCIAYGNPCRTIRAND